MDTLFGQLWCSAAQSLLIVGGEAVAVPCANRHAQQLLEEISACKRLVLSIQQ